MVSPMYDLTPFPTPPSPPRQGLVGWLQRRISKRNLHASEIPLPPRPSPPVLPQPSTEPRPLDETHHEHPPTKYHHQHHHSAVIEISRPTSSEIRRVNFPEPTTTAFFSPPSIPSDSSCCTRSSCSSLLQSSLPESSSTHDTDSPIVSRYGTWSRSVTNLSKILEVDTPQSEEPEGGKRVFDDSMARLVSLDISGVSPFLVFLLAMPFVGVATHTGCVAAMGHGVKRAIGRVRIEGGQRVVYPQKRRCRSKEEEGRVEMPVYGVEYIAYALGVEADEVVHKKDKGKRRTVG